MMDRCTLGGVVVALALSWAAAARAEPLDDAAQADAAFKEAMQLRSGGHDAAACPKFAESQRLAPAVGVTLYLADCYEKTGRTASAWREFRSAERLARARNDKRADVAGQRAAALESNLYRLTVSPPEGAAKAAAAVQVDGAAVPAEYWNSALAVDPGDHVVTLAIPGQATRTFNVHVDGSNPSALVRMEEPPEPAAAPAPAVATTTAPASETEPPVLPSSEAAARWGAAGLILVGAAGVGIGTWFVTSKTRDMDNGQLCEPHLRPGAIPAATVAFAAGGVALISGVTLYYVHRPGRSELSVTTAALPGGAGAVFRTTF
jgi:hypothetical protein